MPAGSSFSGETTSIGISLMCFNVGFDDARSNHDAAVRSLLDTTTRSLAELERMSGAEAEPHSRFSHFHAWALDRLRLMNWHLTAHLRGRTGRNPTDR